MNSLVMKVVAMPRLPLIAAALVAASLASTPAAASVVAAPVVPAAGAGAPLTVTSDGSITVTFTGRNGSYRKSLFLVGDDGDTFLFDGADAQAGDTRTITGLEAGATLTFRLAVTTRTGNQFDLFTGAGTLNPRGFANARAITMGAGMAMISFEDLIGGGDLDFNDFGFNIDGAQAGTVLANPLPGAAALMLTAIGGLAVARRKRG